MKHYFTLISLALSTFCSAQDIKFTRDIDSLVSNFIKTENLPSAAVGVVYENEVLYQKVIVNQDAIADFSDKTIYNIASVAKPFVATAIILLEQEGKLKTTDPVIKYLPGFSLNSKYTHEITLEMLLTHTSGLPATKTKQDYEYLSIDTTDQALSNHINTLQDVKLNFRPGKKYSYSNLGYEVLGEIIAKTSGLSFDDYMHTFIFKPLDMDNTSYVLSDFDSNLIATPFSEHPYKKTSRFPYNRAFSPSGNLFTTISDMNRWMIFNLQETKINNKPLLTPENYQRLITPKVDSDESMMAFGWFVQEGILVHDGKDLGYSSLMILYKQPKIGIMIMINHQEADCNKLLNLIAKSIQF